jgi:hypothetical protein
VILVGVGLYACNTGDGEEARIQKDGRERVMAHDWAVQMHGFYVDLQTREMTFDVVMSFDIAPKEGLKVLYEEISRAYPDYSLHIAPDVDVSD